MLRIAPLWLSAGLALAQAQPGPVPHWLDSPAAATFRQRVIDLAVLYDESSGIDPQGFKVVTRKLGAGRDRCVVVEAVTWEGERPVRRDEVAVCPKPPTP